jgi:hypothetical protein
MSRCCIKSLWLYWLLMWFTWFITANLLSTSLLLFWFHLFTVLISFCTYAVLASPYGDRFCNPLPCWNFHKVNVLTIIILSLHLSILIISQILTKKEKKKALSIPMFNLIKAFLDIARWPYMSTLFTARIIGVRYNIR